MLKVYKLVQRDRCSPSFRDVFVSSELKNLQGMLCLMVILTLLVICTTQHYDNQGVYYLHQGVVYNQSLKKTK